MAFPPVDAGLAKNNIKIFQPSRQPVLRGFHPRCHRNTLVLNPRLKVPSLSFMYSCHRRPKLMLELLVLDGVHMHPKPRSVPYANSLR